MKTDLPQLDDQIHVDSVNWVSYDGFQYHTHTRL